MESRTLGDYRLIELLHETAEQQSWLAEQVSIQRPVVLVELTDLSKQDDFLANVRAKASVDHPLVGSVYEAVSEDHQCFVALERITGTSLAARLGVREAMRPSDLAHILRRTSEAMLQLGSNKSATEPLTPEAIHFDSSGVIRIENLVRAGDLDPNRARADIQLLGRELVPLVADGLPGASRVLTVLAWMRGEGERQLTWEDIRSYGEQIESQLMEPPPTSESPRTTRVAKPKSRFPWMLVGLGCLLLIGGAIVFFPNDQGSEVPPTTPSLPEPVLIESGKYPTPDGQYEKTPAFEMAAHEVTIGEYRKFLDVLAQLDGSDSKVFDAEGQPESKNGHAPKDWDAMLKAARDGGSWKGRPINQNCPVVNVDWWDACAYSKWKGCRLPTQNEWFAGLRSKTERPELLQPAGWGPVNKIDLSDRTPNGLRGMAGSVAEWTRKPSVNPANPLGPRLTVIIGGSFRKPSNGALSREWTDDRMMRRSDLGFRVIRRPD